MKLDVKQKTGRRMVSFRLKEENVKSIKTWAKENNASESSVVDALIEKAYNEEKKNLKKD